MNNKKVWNIIGIGLKLTRFNTNYYSKNLFTYGKTAMNFSQKLNEDSESNKNFNIEITHNCANVKNNFIKKIRK